MGFFDKIFGGLTKTRRNLEELEGARPASNQINRRRKP